MNKKLLALAVTSALAGISAGVNADTANVTIYGKLYPQFQVDSAHGASTVVPSSLGNAPGADMVSHQEINATNSLIGFKADADIGGGMKGWFQVEQQVNLDTGNGNWSSRNSAVGLSGGFGNIFLGKWDTVYKQLGDPVGFLGVNGGSPVLTANVLSAIPFQDSAADVTLASFHQRPNNNIEYDSPKLGPVTIMANYSPAEAKSAAKNQYLAGIGVKVDLGPLYIGVAAERHNDFFGASSNLPAAVANSTTGSTNPALDVESKDTAVRFSAMYKLPTNTSLGVDVASIEYKENGKGAGKFESYKHNAVSLVAQQQLGGLGLAVSVVRSDKGTCKLTTGDCDASGLDATMVNLGVRYDFSKRTGVFAIGSKIMNKDSAQFNGIAGTTAAPGADPQAVAIGIIHSF